MAIILSVDRAGPSFRYGSPTEPTMSPDTTFSRWLKQRRRALDLTQEELAQAVGCAVETIRKLEAGKRRPSKPLAERLAQLLRVPPAEQPAFLALARPRPSEVSLPPPALFHPADLTTGIPLAPTAAQHGAVDRTPADFPPLRTIAPVAGGERQPGIPLLATKLYVPRARPTLLARPRLLARLDASLAGGRCTLLSAPAGAGKTSLLASWLAGVDRPVTWLSLDEHDQDAHQVLRYLIAALQTVAPACGRTALAWLDAPSPPPPEVVLTALVNDLAALPEPCLLVLDDYHTVEADVVMLGYMALARLQHARGDDASASATLISFADLA